MVFVVVISAFKKWGDWQQTDREILRTYNITKSTNSITTVTSTSRNVST